MDKKFRVTISFRDDLFSNDKTEHQPRREVIENVNSFPAPDIFNGQGYLVVSVGEDRHVFNWAEVDSYSYTEVK